MAEYEPDFIVDELLSLPDPLDANIATVKVWTDANDASQEHDVLVSSSVGTDIIEISVDGEPLEAEVAIYQAEVVLAFANCRPSYGEDFARLFGGGGQTVQETSTLKENTGSEVRADLSTKPQIGGHRTRDQSNEVQRSSEFLEVPFEHHASQAILFGDWKQKTALRGTYIPHYRGWRVQRINKEEVSGVSATIRVKKNWIDLLDVKPSPESRLGKVFYAVRSSKDSSDKKKARLFEQLLKELVLLGLQSKDEKRMANLAVSGFIVRPTAEHEELLVSDATRREISIPEALLLPLLKAPAGQEEAAFKSLKRAAMSRGEGRATAFTPQSGYLDAKNAYIDLCFEFRENGEGFDLEALNFEYGDALLTDLRAIGAISRNRGRTVYFISPFPNTDPDQALVGSQETLKFAESLVRDNPEISGAELGFKMASHLGRTWSEGSAKRYGGQLRNWALRRQNPSLGRAKIISGPMRDRVETMLEQGRPATEIGRALGINPETVRRHVREQDTE